VLPERALALRASAAAYGKSTPELLAKYDRDTSSWRMLEPSLFEASPPFSETWPRSGTMRNGTAYLLPPLVRLTDEIDCGSWRTPQARDGDPRGQQSPEKRMAGGHSVSLAEQVMWPTPRAEGHDAGGVDPQRSLYASVRQPNGGSLNPTWVEWLMGFPIGFTDLGR
jgi:hypothetical protein